MNIISHIIAICIAVCGWHEIYKSAEERNWIRLLLGIILLALAASI